MFGKERFCARQIGARDHDNVCKTADKLYSGKFLLNEAHTFNGGYPQGRQNMFCLETENMPNSVNHEDFTDCTLDIGDTYVHNTVYKFSMK